MIRNLVIGILLATGGGCILFDDQLHGLTPDGPVGCASNAECTAAATAAGGGGEVPAVCLSTSRTCATLTSEDCATVTGDYTNDRAVIIGSLFSTTGSQAATNLARQESAALAVEQINATGGLPGVNLGAPRPLVMVSCDEATNLLRAGGHLINDLHVPAIIGPNTSQDTIDLTTRISAAAGTAVLTPTGVASSIANLSDNGLSFQMVPNDVQRAPLMIAQINTLEALVRSRGKSVVKLAVVYRNDALGVGTRTALDTLTLNGKTLSDPINIGQNVRIDPYDFTSPNQDALVAAYVTFVPDIVVVAGTAEAVTQVMLPLERDWPVSAVRPLYVGIDSIKVPDLITAVTGNDDLRRRIRGTGVTPGSGSAAIYNSFKIDYSVRYPGKPATISGMGSSYDAAYAIAFAIAAVGDAPITGASIVAALPKLAGGSTGVSLGATTILAAFQRLTAGESITAVGTFGPLEWDGVGAKAAGVLEMWCINATGTAPSFQSSGLTYDSKQQSYQGVYVQCAP